MYIHCTFYNETLKWGHKVEHRQPSYPISCSLVTSCILPCLYFLNLSCLWFLSCLMLLTDVTLVWIIRSIELIPLQQKH